MTKIFCAIDTNRKEKALDLAGMMFRSGCGIKLGLEFFVSEGPQAVLEIKENHPELPIFLDLKFHDIPNTAMGAARAAASLGVAYMTLHASGGGEMMQKTKAAVAEESEKRGIIPPKLLAVTVLTSLNEKGMDEVGQKGPVGDQVKKLADLAAESGMDGIVCSAHEIEEIRKQIARKDFVLMVPGIRPKGSDTGDQKRVMTPEEAMEKGATHLVIGRPITGAEDPEKAAREISAALS